jgi:hypothetical protein
MGNRRTRKGKSKRRGGAGFNTSVNKSVNKSFNKVVNNTYTIQELNTFVLNTSKNITNCLIDYITPSDTVTNTVTDTITNVKNKKNELSNTDTDTDTVTDTDTDTDTGLMKMKMKMKNVLDFSIKTSSSIFNLIFENTNNGTFTLNDTIKNKFNEIIKNEIVDNEKYTTKANEIMNKAFETIKNKRIDCYKS